MCILLYVTNYLMSERINIMIYVMLDNFKSKLFNARHNKFGTLISE